MEQDTTAVMPVMDSDKQKDGKGWKIATIITAVIAVCGIGFGVYGMIQSSQKDSQISDLKVQVDNLNGRIAALGGKEIENANENDVVSGVIDSTKENPEDYIYVGEWGIKIKILNELSNISYEYLGDGYHRSCRTLGVSASTKGDGSKPSFVKTGGDNGDYLGYVMRCPKEDFYPYGAVINIDDPNYSYNYEQIQYSITQTDWESESVDTVKNMLMNPDNYSAI